MTGTDQLERTASPEELRGIALLSDAEPTGLRIMTARIAVEDLPIVRDAVDAARQTVKGLKPGEWEDVLIVWSRPGRRPLPEALSATPGMIAGLRDLIRKLDQ